MSNRHARLPGQIDPFRLAEAGRELQGSLEISRMARLTSLLISSAGEVVVTLSFGVDEQGARFMQGQLAVELGVRCQRCMEPMHQKVNTSWVLGFANSPDAAERLPGQYEPYVIESVPVVLADIVEDELILALSNVPRHPLQECAAREYIKKEHDKPGNDKQVAGGSNPFAVLAQLKTDNND